MDNAVIGGRSTDEQGSRVFGNVFDNGDFASAVIGGVGSAAWNRRWGLGTSV